MAGVVPFETVQGTEPVPLHIGEKTSTSLLSSLLLIFIHLYWVLQLTLKVHFVNHNLMPPFFSKKVGVLTSAEAYRYVIFMWKIFFLQIHLPGKIIGRIVYLLCRHRNYHHSGLYATLRHSKTCITH